MRSLKPNISYRRIIQYESPPKFFNAAKTLGNPLLPPLLKGGVGGLIMKRKQVGIDLAMIKVKIQKGGNTDEKESIGIKFGNRFDLGRNLRLRPRPWFWPRAERYGFASKLGAWEMVLSDSGTTDQVPGIAPEVQ
jgi:hypothetical protein